MLRMVDLIEKKKQGKSHDEAEIRFIVRGYTAGELPDYQMSAWLMAVWFRGLSTAETAWLTMAMAHSGNIVDLSEIDGIKVDKHSTGGVGDTTTLIITPLVAAAGVKAFEMLEKENTLQDHLHENVEYFISKMKEAKFDIKPTESAICAVMLYDAKLSQEFAAELLEEGIYVIGFSFPVVPRNEARIRVQLSAAHTREHLDKAIAAFIKVGKKLEVI